MEEYNIEIRSEKARSLVGRMPSFYTVYGIIAVSVVMITVVAIFCRIKIQETLSFPVKCLPGSNVAYVSMPVEYEMPEQNFIVIRGSLVHKERTYAVSKIKVSNQTRYIYFVFTNGKHNLCNNAYAVIPIRRYTFIQCMNIQGLSV